MIHWTDIAGQLAMVEKFKIRLPHPEAPRPFLLTLGSLYLPYKVRVWTMRAEIKECTLIARSVNDMTKEEGQKRQELMDLITVFDVATNEWHVVDGDDSVKSFLYLISIGVLPPNVSTENVKFTTPNGE